MYYLFMFRIPSSSIEGYIKSGSDVSTRVLDLLFLTYYFFIYSYPFKVISRYCLKLNVCFVLFSSSQLRFDFLTIKYCIFQMIILKRHVNETEYVLTYDCIF